MNSRLKQFCAGWILLVLTACGSGDEKARVPEDRFNKGTIQISCDESFKPVMDAQVAAYMALFPETKIIVHYKPEVDCIRDLWSDSTRMVFVTRTLSAAEKQGITDSFAIEPSEMAVARDVVAVLVNASYGEAFFTMNEVRDILNGKAKENLIPVFDGNRSTSTVRFVMDSVLRSDTLSSVVASAPDSRSVIQTVIKDPRAVGFVGFSWIGNRDDSAQLAYRKALNIAFIESKDSAGKYLQPSQYNTYTNEYPMVRDLVYILKEKHPGLGQAFARFLTENRGQLIFKRAYLFPIRNPNYIRDVNLSKD